jgi:ribosomal protein S18 acetylase RimI-like enzyme
LQARIQAYLRAVAPLGRDSEQIGPFLATFTPTTNNPYLNYAIPADDATPTHDEVVALVDAYHRRQRRPRLEYVTEAAPAVENALLADGFTIEGRLPVMITDSSTLTEPRIRADIELVSPESDDELYAMAVVQAEAYEATNKPTRADVQRQRAALAAGALAVIARDRRSGVVVGAGSSSPIRDGLTEVAAIGVAVTHRRQGIGAALAARLASVAISQGATTPWLMAAHDAERRIYERAGFRTISDILHISRE